MKDNLHLCNNITENVIFVSGITRSGKSLLCPIVSTFKKVENFTLNSTAETAIALFSLNLIKKNVAKYLIKTSYNEIFYNLSIGRNVNLKKFDYSSILNHQSLNEYRNRISSHDHQINFKKILKKNFFPTMFHDLVYGVNLLLEIFPKSKILNLERHPVDLLSSWKKKGYGEDYYNNERNLILSFKINRRLYPFYMKQKIKEYLKFKNDENRIVSILWEMRQISNKNIKKINKKNFLRLSFDQFTINTSKNLQKVCKFLKLKKTKNTEKELIKQRCPRKIDFKKRDQNYNEIIDKLTFKNRIRFNKLIFEYEKII